MKEVILIAILMTLLGCQLIDYVTGSVKLSIPDTSPEQIQNQNSQEDCKQESQNIHVDCLEIRPDQLQTEPGVKETVLYADTWHLEHLEKEKP